MTTELEQEFFKMFGIEPKHIDNCKIADEYWNNEELANKYFTFERYMKSHCPEMDKACYSTCKYAYNLEKYPEITDRRLLQMICLLAQYRMNEAEFYKIKTSSIVILKNYVLGDCIDILRYLCNKEDFKHQIQQLFKEGE